jgi:hypothetical protein
MFFVDHNFLESYSTALTYKDNEMMSDIISSEIAKIVLDNKKKLLDIVRKYKSVSENISDNDLILMVTKKELLSRPEFLKEFSFLILSEAPLTNPTISQVNSVSDTLLKISTNGSLLQTKSQNHLETVQTQIQEMINKNKATIKLKHILIFVGLVVAGWWVYKKYFKNPTQQVDGNGMPIMAGGGNVDTNINNPMPEIKAPVPEMKAPEINSPNINLTNTNNI